MILAKDDTLEVALASAVMPATAFGEIESGGAVRPGAGCEGGGFVRFAVVRCRVWGDAWR